MPARAPSELDALVRRIQAEGLSEELAAELYHHLYPKLHTFFANRRGLREQAEDLAHDTLLRIYEGIGGFRHEASVATWARSVAANVLSNARRESQAGKRRVYQVPLDAPLGSEGLTPAELLEDPAPSPEEQATTVDDRRRAWAMVAAMPGRMRRCWLLREIQGLSEQEAAAVLQVTVGTVKSQTHEARKRLRGVFPDLSGR